MPKYLKYLPSKKFVITLASIVFSLAIIWLLASLGEKVGQPDRTSQEVSASAQNKMKEFMALDSDQDGLKDWEEALWKTDSKNPDTDGDGTADGEEVKANRDPLKANTAKAGATPTDLLDVKTIEENKKTDAEFAALSQTDQLAHTLFSQYIASKGMSGTAISDTNKQIILDTAVSMTENVFRAKYSLSDLKKAPDLSSSTLMAYATSLNHAFGAGTADKVTSDMDIIKQAVKNSDEKVLAQLDPIIKSYRETVSRLASAAVPVDALAIHLNLLNDLDQLALSLEYVKLLFSDPVKAVGGINYYQTSLPKVSADIGKMRSYFLNKGFSLP